MSAIARVKTGGADIFAGYKSLPQPTFGNAGSGKQWQSPLKENCPVITCHFYVFGRR
jgi:hypothetical protein